AEARRCARAAHLPALARYDRADRAGVSARGPRPGLRHRPHRRKPEYRADAGGDRLPSAGRRLALFRAGADADLSLAAPAQASGALGGRIGLTRWLTPTRP